MSENPYAPPAADVETPARGGPMEGTGDFLIGQCFSDAWATTWASFPLWLGVGLASGIVMMLSGLTIIGIFLVWPVVVYGVVLFLLRVHDGTAAFDDLWAGFRNYGSTLGSGFALGFLMVLLTYVGQIPAIIGTFSGSLSLTIVGQILTFAWSFVLVRFYFAFFLWVDRDERPIDAIGLSWTLTAPVKWKMIGLNFCMTAIFMVLAIPVLLAIVVAGVADSSVAFALGGVVTAALVAPASMVAYMLWVSAFRQLAGRSEVVR